MKLKPSYSTTYTMAKRSSDHQITRDDDNSDGDEVSTALDMQDSELNCIQEVQVGMVKADPSVLASRPYVAA